jgi:hypothetical protein
MQLASRTFETEQSIEVLKLLLRAGGTARKIGGGGKDYAVEAARRNGLTETAKVLAELYPEK